MSSALTGNKIKDSYQALLKIGTNGSLDPTTPIAISDGLGNDTPLQLAADKLLTNYSGNDIGLNLDFANDSYQFGDFNDIFGYRTSLSILPGDFLIDLVSRDNYLELDGSHNNVWLGYYLGSYNQGNSAVVGNYMFGTDWQINNNDSVAYLFQWNTILNCYNSGLDTETKHMENNFFINISDPGFQITSNPGGDDIISNCLIFGLTDYNNSNSLNILTEKNNNTNVVILNGTGMQFVGRTDTYFSVNASEIILELEHYSGINIIGGDFVFKNDLYTAHHRFTQEESLAINVQGRKAKPINNFSYVTAEYFEPVNTSFGQVQVEEKHLYKYYDDGSVLEFLKDCLDNPNIFVQNNSTYRVTATIVSTTGSGDKGETGNATTEQTWMVCVSSTGVVEITDPCEGCRFTNNALTCNLTTPSSNRLNIWVIPDNVNGNACHVKGVIKLNCITTG
jgi:hypothetical protein